MQLVNMVDCFIEDVCAGKVNETPIAYRTKLNHLIKFLGAECGSITQADMDGFRRFLLNRKSIHRGSREINRKLSLFTVRSILATTRHFLRWATEHGHIPQGISIKNIREPKPEPKAIEHETVGKLLISAEQCGADWEHARNRAIIYMLVDTGGRVGSLCNLEIDALDLDQGYATAKDKGDQLSWLWFSENTVMAIRAWLTKRAELEPKDYKLFTGARGWGLQREGIYRVLERLAKAGGVTGRHNPHSFRHAFARDFLLAGGDLGAVSDLLNHSSIVVTHKYYAVWHKTELKRFHHKYSPGRKLPPVGQGSAKP